MYTCPTLSTSEKLFIILGAGTTSKGSPILNSCYSPQIPRLHTDPSCWPKHQRGWCQWGRTHWQARKLDLKKDTVLRWGHAQFTTKYFIYWKTVKSLYSLQDSKPLCFVCWRSLCKPRRVDTRLYISIFCRSRALFSFNTMYSQLST